MSSKIETTPRFAPIFRNFLLALENDIIVCPSVHLSRYHGSGANSAGAATCEDDLSTTAEQIQQTSSGRNFRVGWEGENEHARLGAGRSVFYRLRSPEVMASAKTGCSSTGTQRNGAVGFCGEGLMPGVKLEIAPYSGPQVA
jgi:hypothetical protein